jgi:hypothetical protein
MSSRWGERHLRRVLNEYVAYYNESRTHQSLGGNAPERRAVEAVGQVIATPVLGGLHHRGVGARIRRPGGSRHCARLIFP